MFCNLEINKCLLNFQLRGHHANAHGSHRGDAIDELQNAFDLVEKSCPGITEDLVTQIVSRLAGKSMGESQLHRAISNLKGGYVSNLFSYKTE